jgi:S1-C subfamily serine protease
VSQEKISISAEEIAGVSVSSQTQFAATPPLGPAVSLVAKIALAPLVLILPILCLTALAVRIWVRRKEPRIQHAWNQYLCSLLIASGLLATVLCLYVALWPRSSLPSLSFGSQALDAITTFPDNQNGKTHTVEELAKSFKKTIFIVTQQPKWNRLSRENLTAVGFGGGVLIFAGERGYLILSSRHIVDGVNWQRSRPFSGDVAIAAEEGDFMSANIAGRHRTLDLILLRVGRRSGHSSFVQPVVAYDDVSSGERILALGHPEGLLFSISDGIVSRKDGTSVIQITAPVSPGMSGGPVFDLQGRLLGIVSAMLDKQRVPLSENLNFAVRADAVLRSEDWVLDSEGAQLMKEFLAASNRIGKNAHPPTSSPSKTPAAKSSQKNL